MMNEKRSSTGNPFTASQWQELEQQILIYKYMVSGLSIPSDLILPIRRSFLFDFSKASPSLALPQTQLGWSCVQMGIGREAEDPEPGRCRRTDGKKWRCSKEAYPDSKYCERHMHRGKNRSTKHAEIYPTASTNTYFSSSSTHHPQPTNLSISTPDTYHLLNPHSNTARPPGSHFLTTSRTSNLQMNTVSFSNRDYRYGQMMKHLDVYNIISDAAGAERENTLQLEPLGMGSLIEENKKSYTLCKEEEKERQRHASGAERENPLQLKPQRMNSLIEANQRSYSLSKEEEEERQRPLRHFFNEWPQKNKESWMEMEENTSYTKTQLNISFPKWF